VPGDEHVRVPKARPYETACDEAGITSFGTDLAEDATEEEVLAVVAAYNADPDCHGILVQLPMPAGPGAKGAPFSTHPTCCSQCTRGRTVY
jgi:subtilisin family serine protease